MLTVWKTFLQQYPLKQKFKKAMVKAACAKQSFFAQTSTASNFSLSRQNLDNNNKTFTFNLGLLEGRKMLIMSLKQTKKNLTQGCN